MPTSPTKIIQNHIQVIANTAAFHFGYIEQGGSSLYAALSQKVSSREVLKITLGIGGDEVAHFLEWVDFSGIGVQPPVAPVTDEGLTFPNFFPTPETAMLWLSFPLNSSKTTGPRFDGKASSPTIRIIPWERSLAF